MSDEQNVYVVEFKAVELLLHLPRPLLDTLIRMAQWRNCSVEALVIRLLGDNATLQKFFTRESLAVWTAEH